MARINFVDDSLYTEILGAPQTANLLRAIFNAPSWAEAFVKLGIVQMTRSALPRGDRELVFMRMAHKHRAPYLAHNHQAGALNSGLTAEQLQELQKRDYAPHQFSPRQLSILSLVDAAGLPAQADGARVEEARTHLSDEEMIEVFGVIGLAFTVSCITVSLDVELDGEPLKHMEALKTALGPADQMRAQPVDGTDAPTVER